MNLLIGVIMFITVVLLIEGGYFAFSAVYNPEQRKIRRRLHALSAAGARRETVDIVRKKALSEAPGLTRLILSASGVQYLARLLEQANSRYSIGGFLLVSLVLAVVGLLLTSFLTSNLGFTVAGAGVLGLLPFLSVYRTKRQRMLKFQRQLPDALDLVGRALKAGHGFVAGLKMAGDEFPDPIGVEFEKTLDEINYTGDAPNALKNLAQRVDCPDLKFFVTAVLVQRETGGNLAEIIDNLSRLIRKRFELQGRIRALAAEGKLSAIVLLGLPFLIAAALSILNPQYVGLLLIDPIGQGMVAFGGVMMIIGTVVMIKMIKIRV
ncbi:MAG TPA: type II secretion system F family protein [Candidatus Tectomicrobia bacterium]|nr:type II secretion system F family protein [Candidatus Tectomicrobia bacterium]